MPSPIDLPYSPHGVPQAMPVLGASQYPPSFSYAAPQGGGLMPMGMAGSMATGTLGAMGYAVGGIGAAAGVGSFFAGPGAAGSALGALGLLDATGLGAAATLGGAGMSGGLGGMAMMAPPVAVGAAIAGGAAFAGSQLVAGGREYNQVGSQLSGQGFQFANAGAASGRGFSFQGINQITEMMRGFEAEDPFTTMRDMNQMLDKFNQMGMGQGVRDAKEFGKRLTVMTDAVRDIAKEMGTSLENASQMFGQMRQTGFYTSADVMGNTRRMQMARGMGMNQDVFMGMQGQSAGITRGAMMSGKAGALTSSRFAQDLMLGATSRSSGGLGLFTGESLMDITGAATQGEAAAQMGSQFTGLVSNYLTRTGAGRATLLAAGEQRGGRFTGGVDEGAMAQLASGDMRGLTRQAGSKVRTSRGQASFVTRQSDIASSLLESEQGLEAALGSLESEASKWSRGKNIEEDDAVRLFLQKVVGADELMAAKIADFMKNRDELRATAFQRMRQEQTASAMQLEMARNRTFAGLTQRVSGTFDDWVTAPIRGVGSDIASSVDTEVMKVKDAAFGIYRGEISLQARQNRTADLVAGRSVGTAMGAPLTPGRMTAGTALRATAASRGADAALRTRQRLLAGGSLENEDFGLAGDVENQLLGKIEGEEGSRGSANKAALSRIMIDYNMADARGDQEGMREAMNKFKGKVGSLKSMRFLKPGEIHSQVAFMAKNLGVGGEAMAKKIMLMGETEDDTFASITSLRGRTSSAARAMGLRTEDVDTLAAGGAGSEVFAWIGGDANRLEKWEKFRSSTAMLAAGSDEAAIAAAAKRELGGAEFTGAQILAGARMMDAASGNVLAGKTGAEALMAGAKLAGGTSSIINPALAGKLAFKALGGGIAAQALGLDLGEYSRGSGLGDLGRAGAELRSYISESGTKQILAVSEHVKKQQDAVIGSGEAAALKANLATAPPELREALGDALTDLEEADTPKKLMAAAGKVLEKMESGDLDNVRGSQFLGGISDRMAKGRKSTKGLMEAYRFKSTKEIEDALTNLNIAEDDTPEHISGAEREALVQKLGESETYTALTAGGGQGLFVRGMSAEEKMLSYLDTTAVKVKTMAETVDMLHAGVSLEHGKQGGKGGKQGVSGTDEDDG